jgi:hypothetical protein
MTAECGKDAGGTVVDRALFPSEWKGRNKKIETLKI